MKIKPLDAQTLFEAVKRYEMAAAEQEDDIIKLEKELAAVNQEISDEKSKLSGPPVNADLNLRATFGILNSASLDHEIEIKLTYGVYYLF